MTKEQIISTLRGWAKNQPAETTEFERGANYIKARLVHMLDEIERQNHFDEIKAYNLQTIKR